MFAIGPAAFALLSALSYGAGDFLGGRASTRLPTLTVLLIAQMAACSVAVLAAVTLAFTATPTAGADPGLTGTLMLRTEVENGATELEGRIIPSATVNGANVDPAALTALVAEIKARVDPLRTAFVAEVDALKQKLKADLAAATTDPEYAADLKRIGSHMAARIVTVFAE